MKELYKAPEAELLCFVPMQNIAFAFDDLLNPGGSDKGKVDFVQPSDGDIPMDILP